MNHGAGVSGNSRKLASLPSPTACLMACLMLTLAACNDTTGLSDPRIAWYRPDATGAANLPYADSGIAVFTSFNDMRVDAFDARTGAPRWQTHLPVPAGAPSAGMPTIANVVGYRDVIVVPAWDLVGLDRATGAVRWTLHESDDFPGYGAASVAGGQVYAVGKYLYSINATTGGVNWRKDLGEQPFHPVVADTVIYVATRGYVLPGILGNGHAVALNVTTDSVLWSFAIQDSATPVNGGSIGPAVVTDSLVLFAGVNGTVYALDRGSGQPRWTSSAADRYEGGLAVVGSTVVVAGDRGVVRGLDLTTGRSLWQSNVISSVFEPITAGDGFALVSNGILFAVDPTGAIRWQDGGAGFGGPVYTTGGTYTNGLVYIGSVEPNGSGPGFYAVRAP